ncbi:hypothetical protein ACQPZA_05650 [Pseudonocardia xinjiangensis]|uniref:hypothetical protein n=1 Tax=Pseudonocardia xinjiangensis TaxID=75289 RepID=UPI003D922F99
MQLAEADQLFDQLESLIRRINRTNSVTDLGVDGSACPEPRTGEQCTVYDALPRVDPIR